MNEYLKKTYCLGCKYYEYCFGISDPEVRENCKDKITDGSRAYVKEAPRWGEMSYYKY